MDFFARQDRSRKKTVLLVSLFVVGVAVIIISVYAIVAVGIYLFASDLEFKISLRDSFFQPKLFWGITCVTLFVIVAGCIIKIRALAKGGRYIAEAMGGKPISPATTDPDERRLLNVVEEMSLASGIPVPQVFLLEREKSINAFAAGYDPSEAVIAVTLGCLKLLSRDELQGVIAHEYSHILNGDMRLNIRLMGWLGGITSIGMIGYTTIRLIGRTRHERGILFVIAFGLLAVGYGGLFLGRLIQCAVSRQREFLADASAVQFTRNPPGLSGALKKIGGCLDGSLVKAPTAVEACHMFFNSAVKSLLSTHPPIGQRISLLEPGFDGEYVPVVMWDTPKMNLHATAFADSPAGASQPSPRITINAKEAVGHVGAVAPQNVSYGRNLMAGIPKRLREEASHPLGALAVVCGILLDRDPVQRKIQIEAWCSSASSLYMREMLKLVPEIQKVDARYLLPLVDLAFPALRQLSPRQYENLLKWIKILVEADKQISVFEFTVQEIVKRRLAKVFEIKSEEASQVNAGRLQDDIVGLLSLLAHTGHHDQSAARQAFAAAAAMFPVLLKETDVVPAEGVSLKRLGRSLDNLSHAKLKTKKTVFEACAQCVLFDQTVTVKEAELLRAIAYALGLPLPPFLPQAN